MDLFQQRPNAFTHGCPSRVILDIIADKWSLLLIMAMRNGPLRTGDLRRRVAGISQKMLIQTLRSLEDIGLVIRTSYGEVPPRVEYGLTELGCSLEDVVTALDRWVMDHYDDIQIAQRLLAKGSRHPPGEKHADITSFSSSGQRSAISSEP